MDYSRRTFLKYVTILSAATSFIVLNNEIYAQEIISFIIPDQRWTVNEFVYIDLVTFIIGSVPENIIFSINKPLPEGVDLTGSIISGVPINVFSENDFIVTITCIERVPNSPNLISIV